MSEDPKTSTAAAARALGGRSPLRHKLVEIRTRLENWQRHERLSSYESTAPYEERRAAEMLIDWPNWDKQIVADCEWLLAQLAGADDLEAVIGTPQLDLSNHHNALMCPYCNPGGSVDRAVIEGVVSHWFAQGGEAQFGTLEGEPQNADEVVSAILSAVRKSAVGEPGIAARPHPDPVEIYEKALRSIAANACCLPCREAGLVAQAALRAAAGGIVPPRSDTEGK